MLFPSLIHATAYKATQHERLGVGVALNKAGILVISIITDTSPFRVTELRVGQELLAINDVTAIVDAKHAISILKELEGDVSLVTRSGEFPPLTRLALIPALHGTSPGIRFGLIRDCLVRVDYIASDGLFAGTNLNVGDIVLSVNNSLVSTPQAATRMLFSLQHGMASVFFLSMSEFQKNAVQWLLENDSIHWPEPKWDPANNTVLMWREVWDRTVSLSFTKEGRCEVPDEWRFIEAPSGGGPVYFPLWYQDQLVPALHMLNGFIDRNLGVFKQALLAAQKECTSQDVGDAFVENLSKLAALRRSDLLTEHEFAAAKAKLLGLYAS